MTPWFPSSESPWEGTFIRAQADALTHAGADISIARIVPGRTGTSLVALGPNGEKGAHRWLPLGATRARHGRALNRVLGAHDVLVAHGIWAAVRIRRTPQPLVIVLHGIDPLHAADVRRKPWRGSLIRAALSRAVSIVAVGEPVLESLPAPLRAKAAVIENGVDLETFRSREASARTRMNLPGYPRWICVGNLNRTKNHQTLLEAFRGYVAHHPDASLAIIGDGGEAQNLRAQADDLKISSRVTFLGRLPPQRVAAELADADLFVLPSRGDAFGCVYVEAMAVGVPTLVSSAAGVARIVTSDVFKHDPSDPEEIVTKANRILSTEVAYLEAVDHGLSRASQYTWSRNASLFLSVLETVKA